MGNDNRHNFYRKQKTICGLHLKQSNKAMFKAAFVNLIKGIKILVINLTFTLLKFQNEIKIVYMLRQVKCFQKS